MLKNLKNAAKNSIIYGIGNISGKLVGFILIPLYTREFSVSEYGILSLLEITSALFINIFGFKIYQGFFRLYWDKDFLDKQKALFFTAFSTLSIFSFLFVVIGISQSLSLSKLLFNNIAYSDLVKLMIIVSALQIINQMSSTLMRIQEKSVLYTITTLIRITIILLLTVYLIVYKEMGIRGIYYAQITGQVIFFLILLKYIFLNTRFKFEFTIIREILLFGLPLIFSSLFTILLSISDRYMLRILRDLEEVGIYSLGYKVANTTKVFLVTSIQLAISPILYKIMNDPNNKRFYSKIMTYFSFIVMIFILFIAGFSKELIEIVAKNKQYWQAFKVVPIISISIFFGMLMNTASTGILITKNTQSFSIIIIFSALINILLNWLFIPSLNEIGAAIASLISQIISFLLVLGYAQKYYFIPYELKNISSILLTGILLLFIMYKLSDLDIILGIAIKLLLISLFPLLLYFLNFYEKIELKTLKSFVLKLVKLFK